MPTYRAAYPLLKILLIKQFNTYLGQFSSYKNGSPHFEILEVKGLGLHKFWVTQVSSHTKSSLIKISMKVEMLCTKLARNTKTISGLKWSMLPTGLDKLISYP
jgi:hypothetical protein